MQSDRGQRAAQTLPARRRAARNRGAARRSRHGLRRRRRLGLGAARARPLCRLSAARCAWDGDRARPTALRRCAPTPIRGPASNCRRTWRCRSARCSRSSGRTAISRRPRSGSYLWARHLAPLDFEEPDFVAVAERFLETPYLWGGRTSEGIDCSGLVQTALQAAGIPAPRDSDMLEAALGQPAAVDGALMRGDLVFWRGHVGIMRDSATLLHANGWHMKVASEPLAEACARIAASGGGGVLSVKRLAGDV